MALNKYGFILCYVSLSQSVRIVSVGIVSACHIYYYVVIVRKKEMIVDCVSNVSVACRVIQPR